MPSKLIFRRKSGENTFAIAAEVEVTQETATHVVFQCQEYLPVAIDSHYYVMRKVEGESLELWLIVFSNTSQTQAPYTYRAELHYKYEEPKDA